MHSQAAAVARASSRMGARAAPGDEFVHLCRNTVAALVAKRRCSVHDVAMAIGLHRRTLNRRLATHGTSVASLVIEAKVELARRMLADTRMLMSEIAEALNIAHAATLTRLFQRETGQTPSAWRKHALR
jgi:AraC-like DNA-binding protein